MRSVLALYCRLPGNTLYFLCGFSIGSCLSYINGGIIFQPGCQFFILGSFS